MHILALQASPRRAGNTAALLRAFEQRVQTPHTFERVEICRLTLYGCTGCGACQEVFDRPGCRQKDDAPGVFERMAAADLLVYAAPLYCWSFPSEIKALIDRQYCLVKWRAPGGRKSLLPGKRAALLVTCGDEAEGNADLIQVMFRRMAEVADWDVAGIRVLPHCPSRLPRKPELEAAAEALAGQAAAEWLGG